MNIPRAPIHSLVHIASCYFTMVARSADETRSLELPAFEPADDVGRTPVGLRRRDTRQRRCNSRSRRRAEKPPSRDEYQLLQRLHSAQEDPGFRGLLAADLVTTGWERMYPEQENVPKKIFGGYVIRKAYEQSAICAELLRASSAGDRQRQPHQLQPAGAHGRASCDFEASHPQRTPRAGVCAVETEILRLGLDRSQAALSNTCVFTFVNVDETLTAQPVPTV